MAESPNRIVSIDGRDRRPWALKTREDILKAAISEIADRGYENARLVDIAERAGLTVGSIYTWFTNKRDLFVSALSYSIEEQQAKAAKVIAELHDAGTIAANTPKWIIAVAALNPFDDTSRQPSTSQRLVQEALRVAWRDDELRSSIVPLIHSIFNQYLSVMDEASAEGEVADHVDVEIFARIMMAIPIGLTLMNLAALDPPDQRRYIPFFQSLGALVRQPPTP